MKAVLEELNTAHAWARKAEHEKQFSSNVRIMELLELLEMLEMGGKTVAIPEVTWNVAPPGDNENCPHFPPLLRIRWIQRTPQVCIALS